MIDCWKIKRPKEGAIRLTSGPGLQTSLIVSVLKPVVKEKRTIKKHIIGLVGLTGIGKTTTLVKLAASEVLTAGKRVGVISLDNG